MITQTSQPEGGPATHEASGMTARLGRGYDVDFSIRAIGELRRHAKGIDVRVFDALANLHSLDRMLATREWQHYARLFATPTALVAVHAGINEDPAEATCDVLPYDDLMEDVDALVEGGRDGEVPQPTWPRHPLQGDFASALEAYEAVTAFDRQAEERHGLVLFEAGNAVN